MKPILACSAVAAAAFIAVSLGAQQPAQPTPAQQQAKIRQVMEFYRPGITPEERIALIHPNYQQHNQTYVKYAKDHNVSAFQAFAEIRRQQGRDQAAAAERAKQVLAERGPISNHSVKKRRTWAWARGSWSKRLDCASS